MYKRFYIFRKNRKQQNVFDIQYFGIKKFDFVRKISAFKEPVNKKIIWKIKKIILKNNKSF